MDAVDGMDRVDTATCAVRAARLRITAADVDRANESWPCNCGPGALCAALGMTPDELRPHLLDFEDKGYTNPTLMLAILKGLKVAHRIIYRSDTLNPEALWPKFGLVRIQWAGPWTKAGVQMRVRYRKTHWIAVRDCVDGEPIGQRMVFDINAVNEGWLTMYVWRTQLVPWLLPLAVPNASGVWWPTHCIEVER